jgi:hypothetical protein
VCTAVVPIVVCRRKARSLDSEGKKTKCNVEYFKLGMVNGDPGSPVSIVFGYGLDYRAIDIRSPAEAKGFFL